MQSFVCDEMQRVIALFDTLHVTSWQRQRRCELSLQESAFTAFGEDNKR
jgi:hypothetical protein